MSGFKSVSNSCSVMPQSALKSSCMLMFFRLFSSLKMLSWLNLLMPVMNGLEATAAIRKLDSETAKHIPIIALTANAYHEDIQKCLAAGMNAHLSKPINIDRAVRTIIECARTAKENG